MILVDYDNTVVDTNQRVKEYLDEQGYSFYPENITRYDYSGKIGVCRSRVYNCFSQPDFYLGDWKYYDGAVSALRLLSSVDDEVKIWTQIQSRDKKVQANRVSKLYELKELCPELCNPDVTIDAGRKPIYARVSAVFDDCLDNLQMYAVAGVKTKLFLIDQPYNKEENNKGYAFGKFIRVKSLLEGAEMYLNEAIKKEAV